MQFEQSEKKNRRELVEEKRLVILHIRDEVFVNETRTRLSEIGRNSGGDRIWWISEVKRLVCEQFHALTKITKIKKGKLSASAEGSHIKHPD